MRKGGVETTKTVIIPSRPGLNDSPQGVRPSGLMGQLLLWTPAALTPRFRRRDTVWSYSGMSESGSCTAMKTRKT